MAECFQIAGERTMGTLRPCKEESVNFDETQNLYIEGDNLEVLKILQRSYFNKVKMIYIDPPYNTGNDFVYHNLGRILPLLSERSERKWGMNADFLLKALTISKIYAIIDT